MTFRSLLRISIRFSQDMDRGIFLSPFMHLLFLNCLPVKTDSIRGPISYHLFDINDSWDIEMCML